MPAYHSAFLQDTDVRIVGNFGLLPLRTRTRGPAYTLPALPPNTSDIDVDPDSEHYDVLDETLTLFRANTFFRNFEIKGPADRTLIYGILWISDCLSKIKPTMGLRDSEKALQTSALDHFALPGDPAFPLNALYQPPKDRADAETLRGYISQMRQELVIRLLSRIYADGTGKPSKWWLSFTKRRFMNKSLCRSRITSCQLTDNICQNATEARGGAPPKGDHNPHLFTIRPFPTPVSHKTFLRINLNRGSLNNLDIKSGDLCHITTAEISETAKTPIIPAIAWLASDAHLQKGIALISDNVRTALNVGFEDKVLVGKYTGKVEDAVSVLVKEIEYEEPLPTAARPGTTVPKKSKVGIEKNQAEGWRWFLEHVLVETKYISEGLILNAIEYKGTKRAFRVGKIVAKDVPQEINGGHSVPAYKMTESTTIELTTNSADPSSSGSSHARSKTTRAPRATAMEENPPVTIALPSRATFASIGGLSKQIGVLKTLLLSTLYQSHHFTRFNLTPPRGILLYGPPGTGKTLLLKAIASELSATCFILNGSIVGKYMGESEAAVRRVFAEARAHQPAIVFVDEVDSLAPRRTAGDSGEGRVVTTLLTEMDGLDYNGEAVKVVVVAATNRPNAVDGALRRPGRFDREIEVGIPDVDSRREILEVLMKELPFEGREGKGKEEFIKMLAARTHGFVGADLESLVRTGFTVGLKRLELVEGQKEGETEEGVVIREDDIEAALKDVRPTAMREIFLEPPKVRWSDIGGQEEVKQRLREAVEWPLTHPEVFSRLGGTPRKGLLLYGPPGCSKTLTAKALATEAGLNFMAVKGPELFSMYVGESERAVREIFRKARAASPSIIFFDEIDALSASREGGQGMSGGGGVGASVLTALLNEMDGIESLKNVTILAATNRPEIIDPALLRPGRLDTILYVGPPDLDARKQILQIKTKKMSISLDVDLDILAEKTEGYSGAEIVNICDEAIHYAMRESFDIDAVGKTHFDQAMEKAVPQITRDMRMRYERWSVGGVKKI